MNNSRPIRVLHLIEGLGGGGSERWLWEIVRLSTPENVENRVVTIFPDTGDYVYADRLRARGIYQQRRDPRALSLLSRNIQALLVTERLTPVRKSLALLWRLGCNGLATWELLKALLRFRPDVVHTHTYYGPFFAGLLAKVVFGKPLVHSVAALFSQMKDAHYGMMPTLYARLHHWVDRFFTGASCDELLSLGVPASKILHIRCGVDLQDISAVQNERRYHYAEIRRSLGLPEDAYIALSVGRLHPSKGHLFALRSLPSLLGQFPNLHWVVLGEGAQRTELEAQARELGVAEHVHLIGFQAEPLPYYAAANIYLRTPVFEAENLSSYQAIAMGLPVVGFDTGSETELITKIGNGILVKNQDSAALAHAIASILILHDGGRAVGELGAEYSRQHFDIRQVTSPFFSVYSALGERGKRIRAG